METTEKQIAIAASTKTSARKTDRANKGRKKGTKTLGSQNLSEGVFTRPRRIQLLSVEELLSMNTADETDSLIGSRFLCRGSGGFLFSGTGVGKSVLAVQLAIALATGGKVFGLGQPEGRPLRVLYIQAENDAVEVAKVMQSLGVIEKWSKAEESLLKENLRVVIDRVNTGASFETSIRHLLDEQPADLIIADPFLSYFGGDVNDNQAVTSFLRHQVSPVLSEYKAGILWVHHTTKGVNGRGAKSGASSAYDMLGASELAHWARCALSIEELDMSGRSPSEPRAFRLSAVKRGENAGLQTLTGNHSVSCEIRHTLRQVGKATTIAWEYNA